VPASSNSRSLQRAPRGRTPDAWKPPTRARVLRIRDRLRDLYGIPRMAPHGRPLDELVLTVLSQSTNDRNRDVAFLRLRERFARVGGPQSRIDYAAVLAAPVSEVEEAIRPGGISKVKSARIQAILAAISDPERREALEGAPAGQAPDGRPAAQAPDPLSLEWMHDAPLQQSRDYLCALPGVGRKTAACVLLFSFGLPDVPVDTHVSRVGTRLGLFRPGAPFEELHDQMLAITPPGQELELHVNLLRHGRRTCHARNPSCDGCALVRMCPGRYPTTISDSAGIPQRGRATAEGGSSRG
jgi:endonuclease III